MSEFTGEGFKAEVKGDALIITVDLTNKGGISKSGKSEIIASSRGAAQVDGMSINLNVYRKL